MSIESARRAVEDAVDAGESECSCGALHPQPYGLNAALDELIREVKASLPCYRVPATWDYQRYIPETCLTPKPLYGNMAASVSQQWGQITATGSPCPTCQARAEKVEA